MIRYIKRIDGTMYVVEAAPDTKRKTLQIVSAYIDRGAGTDKKQKQKSRKCYRWQYYHPTIALGNFCFY